MTAFIMKLIHLGFGQVERALLLDRILGGDHHERQAKAIRCPADGRGTLGHGLKHGRTGFWHSNG